ncbi:MAG: MoaD/ThiS family protein [Syntrophaceae bacterium]|nr:MoaD/ThiS family protein [Syntrophaceae bacterium]
MKVTVGAILGVRRLLGWHNVDMVLPDGATISDWLKAIKVPNAGSIFDLMIMENGKINSKYMIVYNRVTIGDQMLDIVVKENDRLVLMDSLHVPSLTC